MSPKLDVAATCLYIYCRQEKKPYMMIDFSDQLSINVFTLGAVYIQPVYNTAAKLIKGMKRDWILTGRRPSGICGAALFIAAHMHGIERSKQDIIAVVHIGWSTVERRDIIAVVHIGWSTVERRVREFANTSFGDLTVEEFDEKGIAMDREKGAPQGEGGTVGMEMVVTSRPRVGSCEHVAAGIEIFVNNMCRECFSAYFDLSGGIMENAADPPSFQRNIRKELAEKMKADQLAKDAGEQEDVAMSTTEAEKQGLREMDEVEKQGLREMDEVLARTDLADAIPRVASGKPGPLAFDKGVASGKPGPLAFNGAEAQAGAEASQKSGSVAEGSGPSTSAPSAPTAAAAAAAELEITTNPAQACAVAEKEGYEATAELEIITNPAQACAVGEKEGYEATVGNRPRTVADLKRARLAEKGGGDGDKAASSDKDTGADGVKRLKAAGESSKGDGEKEAGEEEEQEASKGTSQAIIAVVEQEDTLSDIDDEDIGTYLASKDEAELKEVVWTEMNKHWLEKQASKLAAASFEAANGGHAERVKRSHKRNNAATPTPMDWLEKQAIKLAAAAFEAANGGPVEKVKRNYKRNNAAAPAAENAQEAARLMLEEKKLSNKINYNVLKNLFAEDGDEEGGEGAKDPGDGGAGVGAGSGGVRMRSGSRSNLAEEAASAFNMDAGPSGVSAALKLRANRRAAEREKGDAKYTKALEEEERRRGGGSLGGLGGDFLGALSYAKTNGTPGGRARPAGAGFRR
eukprot:gene4544-14722_t